MTAMNDARVTPHALTRLDIPTGQPFGSFVAAFERAVPEFDTAVVQGITARRGTWAEVEAAVAVNAPHGFVVFTRIDARPLMSLAGHTRGAIAYLMGNHVVAERMYRHTPDALLYAPLRILVYENSDGTADFAFDQPSSVFAGLGIDAVTEVGIELDRKVVDLLRVLSVAVPAVLVAR